MEFDSVQIGAVDFEGAIRAYERLLGVQPVRLSNGAWRFQLCSGGVELEPGEPGLHALRFACEPDGKPPGWHSGTAYGLDVRFDAVPNLSPRRALPDAAVAIDHVVIHSPDLDRAITLWRDRLGLRLALDREFPARGVRIAFFRSAGVTLEFVGVLSGPSKLAPLDPNGPDRLYGIAYRVPNLNALRNRLVTAGEDVSSVRPGHKPGTMVATVRSGTAGVPTLLIEASKGRPAREEE